MLVCRDFILPGTASRECDELVMYETGCLGGSQCWYAEPSFCLIQLPEKVMSLSCMRLHA